MGTRGYYVIWDKDFNKKICGTCHYFNCEWRIIKRPNSVSTIISFECPDTVHGDASHGTCRMRNCCKNVTAQTCASSSMGCCWKKWLELPD